LASFPVLQKKIATENGATEIHVFFEQDARVETLHFPLISSPIRKFISPASKPIENCRGIFRFCIENAKGKQGRPEMGQITAQHRAGSFC
jgi:hypothetical protein